VRSGLKMCAVLLHIITRSYGVKLSAGLDPYLYVPKLADLVVYNII
jgi:hypothetical protein